MTEKLIKLIESELPGLIGGLAYATLEQLEKRVEDELKRVYTHENQIEQRNNFRIKFNAILIENEK